MKIFTNRKFFFHFIDNENSYLKQNTKKWKLNPFHNSWFSVFEPYHYHSVYVAGYYSPILDEIIIYSISFIQEEVNVAHMERFALENPYIFNESKRVKESEEYLMDFINNNKKPRS